MNKIFSLAGAILMLALATGAQAEGLAIFADQSYQGALQEILPLFSEQTGIGVELSVGLSTILAERIRSGIPADVFFPASEDAMNYVMEKGLVDVTLKRNILVRPPAEPAEDGIIPAPQYIPAAVMANSANRLQAMAFLEFLVSESARAVFVRQGHTPP